MQNRLDIQTDIQFALENKKPVVGLESTVLSFGLPEPHNLNTVQSMIDAVEESSSIPAITAIKEGQIKIGLSETDLEYFADTQNEIIKLNRQNFSYGLAQKKAGTTTVSATMICCHMAGIQIFATGGIGGVHRDYADEFDVSSDIYEFTKTPTLVVCSGAKSILDLPKTVELIESLGIPLVGYQTNEFPAFYSRKSGIKIDQTVDTIEEIVELAKTHWEWSQTGIILLNPIPEEDEIPHTKINDLILQAVKQQKEQGISGKKVTPFLLQALSELSKEATLKANQSLLISNAKLAGKIAQEFYK